MRPSREELLFQLALTKPAAERADWLARECGEDITLRQRLAALLAAHDEPGELLPPGAPAIAATLKLDLPDAHDETVGQTLGRYKILEKVGEGGCGVVYVAEQTEPVRRRVALKVIKLGMDTKQVVARFEAERQALAMMDHPNIARVLDAGATETGRPFFVMELVRGIRITDYCDQANLSTKERLDLFIKVCQAIQHAHQKGIIHRDIKPSNILVTLHDGVPVPKVIDFGIAKATEGRLTDATVYTQLHQFIGTPAYMSPEQAEMSGLDIDTRSDIYSLGVLLYELLTGKTPFDTKSLLASGLDEMRRKIREEEPVRPSTRVSTMADAERTSVAKRRQSDAAKLIRLFRGDLDWIVMKTLEKDRTRRYETASALATDLLHFLHLEPVSAVAPSTGYRLRKFIRRNRPAVAMAASLCGLLVCGVATSTWLAIKATRANQVAMREARRATAVSRLLQEMLEGVRPARARGQDVVMLRGILDGTAARMSVELRDQPEAELEMRRIIGRTYEALGLLDLAEPMQRAAAAVAVRLHGRHHTNTAFALAELAFTLRLRSEFNEATNLLQEALATLQQQLGENHAEVAGPLHRLGSVYTDLGRYKEAAPLLTRAVEIRRRTLGAEARLTLDAELDLATLYYREGRLAEAESGFSRVLEIQQRVFGEDDPGTPDALEMLAFVRQDQGRFVEAEGLLLRLLEIKRRLLPAEHPFTLTALNNLAMVYGYQGRYAEAEQLCRKAMESYRRQLGNEHRNTLAMQSNLAEYLRNQRRFADAETLFQQVMEAQRRTMAAGDPFRLETENSLAVQYFMQGRYAEAGPLLTNVLQRRRAALTADDPALADALAQATLLLLVQEKFTEAEPLARQCLALQTQWRPGTWQQSVAQSQLGGCLLGLGRNNDAEPMLRPAAEELKQRLSTVPMIDRARVRKAFERLIQVYETTGQRDEASRWRQDLERMPLAATPLQP